MDVKIPKMIQFRVNIAFVILVGSACAAPLDRAAAADERGRLPETVNRIERETGGKVLSAERSSHNGQEATRIKVYTPEGRVRVMWEQPRDRAPQSQPLPKSQPEPQARPRAEMMPHPMEHGPSSPAMRGGQRQIPPQTAQARRGQR